MVISTPVLIAMRRRMEQAAIPLLWHDVRTPQRQASRVARIMRWMGYEGREASRDAVLRGSPYYPHPDDGRRWRHGGKVRD